MSDRDLRIEVHYEDHGAQQAVKKLDTTLEGVGTTAAGPASTGLTKMSGVMKGALVGAAVAAAYQVTNLVSQLVDMGDQLTKLRDKTGISIGGLQDLQTAALWGGNSLEQVTTAIVMMQKRIAGEDKSAVQALKLLHLELADLRAMAPEQQFYTVAKAIQAVEDPADRTRLRVALMGRSASEVAGTMVQDFDKAAAATVRLSDKTAEALDAAGERWDLFRLNAKKQAAAWVLEAYDWTQRTINSMVVWINKATAVVYDFYAKVTEMAAKVTILPGQSGTLKAEAAEYRAAAQAARDFATMYVVALHEEATAQGKATAAVAAARGPLLDFTEEQKTATKVSGETAAEIWSLAEALKALRINADAAGPELREIDGQLVGIGQSAKSVLAFLGWAGNGAAAPLASSDPLRDVIISLKDVGAAYTTTGTSAKTASKTMRTGLSQAIDVVEELSRVAEMSGHKTTAALLSAAAATAKAFVTGGPWAAAITGAQALLSTFADKLFKTEGRKVNDLRDDFVAAAGGIRELDLKAHEAGITLDRLLRAKTVKDYEAAVKELTTAFDAQAEKLERIARLHDEIASTEAEMATLQASLVPTWEQVSRVMEKYGISLDGAGQKVQQLRMTDWATELLNDWELLQRAGVDTGTILDRMGSKFVDFVRDSIKYGTEIPENMRPVVETLFAQGKLVDANGTKLGSLAGVKFGKPVETEADKINKALQGLVKKLDELVLALQGLVAPSKDAADQVAHHWATEPWAHWRDPEFPTSDDPHGGSVPERPPFVHTGGYIDPRGRVLHYAMGGEVPALLHSGEYVVRRQAVDALGVGTLQMLNRTGRVPNGSAPITVTINNPEIDSTVGLDRFTRRLELALDRAARRARA